jgi:hypothetical protein
MKLTKILGIAAVAALALMAFASSASATTLEIKGAKQTTEVKLEATLASGTSAVLTNTPESFGNTCSVSTVAGKTEKTFTTAGSGPIGGPITSLGFSKCTHETVKVNTNGTLSVEWIKGTTNGTVKSTGASVTTPVALFGGTTNVTCTTNATDLGTITGSKEGNATMDINAVLNCGALLPSALWKGTYTVTSPLGLGVVE